MDIQSLRSWIGRKESQVDHVAVPAVQRLAALLDRDDPLLQQGDPLPRGWHSILFPRVVRHSQLGTDGHPRKGDFLPPVPLPRRMFAGRRTLFHADLQVGDEVHKESTIKDVSSKQGRTGTMVFVTVLGEIFSPRGLAVSEEQDIVYRGEAPLAPIAESAPRAATNPVAQGQPAAGSAVWSRALQPDEVMLFRYSALTYNGHRIHYDLPYATQVEAYPALVMNGGLTTLFLYELARSNVPSPIRTMSSRNVKPLFVNRPMRLEGEPVPGGARLWVLDDSGAVALSAQAEFAG